LYSLNTKAHLGKPSSTPPHNTKSESFHVVSVPSSKLKCTSNSISSTDSGFISERISALSNFAFKFQQLTERFWLAARHCSGFRQEPETAVHLVNILVVDSVFLTESLLKKNMDCLYTLDQNHGFALSSDFTLTSAKVLAL
jgi:hypothetical protein